MDVQYQVAGSHTSCVTFHIDFPVVRTDGRAGEWASGRVGERASGRAGEWASGRAGGRVDTR